jgi:hypothetical protein
MRLNKQLKPAQPNRRNVRARMNETRRRIHHLIAVAERAMKLWSKFLSVRRHPHALSQGPTQFRIAATSPM